MRNDFRPLLPLSALVFPALFQTVSSLTAGTALMATIGGLSLGVLLIAGWVAWRRPLWLEPYRCPAPQYEFG